jgi:hypothetical protein
MTLPLLALQERGEFLRVFFQGRDECSSHRKNQCLDSHVYIFINEKYPNSNTERFHLQLVQFEIHLKYLRHINMRRKTGFFSPENWTYI